MRRLVARRVNKVPEKKKEAEELQRGVETLAQATFAVDTKKPRIRLDGAARE